MIYQLMIAILGLTAIYLTQEKSLRRRRWAPVFGLLSQPFWFIASWQGEQWGIFALSFCYTGIWAKGLYSQWLQHEPNPNQRTSS